MNRLLTLSIGLVCFTVVSKEAQAVDYFWTNPGTGSWFEPTNWTPAAVPNGGGGNFAYVNNGGTSIIDADTINQIQDAFIGRDDGGVGNVNQTGGTVTTTGWSFVGTRNGTGSYTMTGNSSLNTGRLYVGGVRDDGGAAPLGTGTMTITTTGTVTAGGDLSVGTRGGTGQLTINSGTVNANSWMIVGESQNGTGGSNGTVVQNGGALTVGAVDANGRLWIGSQEGSASPTSNGTYTLNDGTLTTPEAQIGRHYTGTFNQNGGTFNITTRESGLGEVAGSVGTYNMVGGTLNSTANFQIGRSGTGVFNQTGGVVNASGFPSIGRFGGSNGTLTITAGTFNQLGAGGRLIVGEDGVGALNLSGPGSIVAEGGITVAQNGGGVGTANLTGGTVVTAGIVGGVGQGTVNFDGTVITANRSTGNFMGGLTLANVKAGGLIIDTAAQNITINQALSHDDALGQTPDGGLTKIGDGTLSLSLPSSYTGPTTINSGKLKVAVEAPVTLRAEWDADALAGAAGSSVGTWADSVAGRNASQATVGNQPTLNVGTLNGHNSVAFNGAASQALDVVDVDSPVAGLTDYTIAFVLRSTTNGVGGTAQWWGNTGIIDAEQPGGTADWGIALTDSGRIGAGQGNPDRTNYSPASVTDGSPHVVVFSVTEGGASFLSIDGSTPAVVSGLSTDPRNASLMRFGAIATGANYFTGELGEVRVYDGGQAPGGVHAIGASLAAEFGLAPFAAYNNVLPDGTALSLAGAGAALDLSDFSETIGSLAGVGGTEVMLGAGTLTFGGNNNDTTFAGKITGTGGVVKTGAGTFELTGTGPNASTFTGPTVVSGGKFRVTGELTGTSSVQVAAGATLSGNGSIATANGNVLLAAGAKLEPGTAAGTLSLFLGTGTLDLAGAVGSDASAALLFELGAIGSSDRVLLSSGQLSIGTGGLEFDDFVFATLAGFGPGTYTLFDSSSPISGTLGLDLTGTIAGLGATLGTADSGRDVVLTVVPEPSSVAMMLGGILVLARRRRRS